jgi:hypothetical protein
LRLLFFNTLRPPTVFILARNPEVFLRALLLGWYVRFIRECPLRVQESLILPFKITEFQENAQENCAVKGELK